MEIIQPSFGIRVRQLRLDKGLSQLELAELVGLSEEQIGNIERGKSWVGEQTLALLSEALMVRQGLLFDYSGNEEFIKTGGLKRRAPRKPSPLIVRHKRKIQIKVPKAQRRRRGHHS